MAELVDVLVSRLRPDAVVASFSGDHDITTRDQVGQLLEDLLEENDVVVVDVSEAAFIDSSFLHNLVRAKRFGSERGKRLAIQVDEDAVAHRALEVSLVLQQFEHGGTRDELLGSPVGARSSAAG